MKNYHLLKPPSVPMPDEETLKAIKEVPREEVKKVLSSEKYQRILAERKRRKLNRYRQWLWLKGVIVLDILLSLVATITGIIALLR